MTTERFANKSTTTLNGGIDGVVNSLVVADPSKFPTSPQFRLLAESELMLVTGVSGANYTVQRGVEGTLAVPHSSGIPLNHILTAGGLDQLKSDILAEVETNLITTAFDIDLTTTGNPVIDTRPATPTGPVRWKLMSIDLRLKVAITGSGSPSSVISIGSTSGGQQIVINQTVLLSASVGDSVGGFSLATLGTDMSQATGFEACYGASQAIYANVTESGSPATGTITAYLLWQRFP